MQLELFSPDRTAIAEGWYHVKFWRLEAARAMFSRVAERWPEDSESREALRWLDVAYKEVGDLKAQEPPERVVRLWAARDVFPQVGLGGRFRQALLALLLEQMELAGTGDPGETPSRGAVLLAAGRAQDAVSWCASAVKAPGTPPDLRRLMGDALWQLERRKAARGEWLGWLVQLEPDAARAAARSLHDPELAEIVASHGIERAPVEAWLRNLAPLLEAEHLPDRNSPDLEFHRTVLAAEAARRRGKLDTAIRHREELLRLDPALFRRYMERLSG